MFNVLALLASNLSNSYTCSNRCISLGSLHKYRRFRVKLDRLGWFLRIVAAQLHRIEELYWSFHNRLPRTHLCTPNNIVFPCKQIDNNTQRPRSPVFLFGLDDNHFSNCRNTSTSAFLPYISFRRFRTYSSSNGSILRFCISADTCTSCVSPCFRSHDGRVQEVDLVAETTRNLGL